MSLKRIVIIDDHPLIRLALRTLLAKEPFEIVAESDDGIEGQRLVDQHNPDVVILDINISRLDGIEVIKLLRRKGFTGIIVVVSAKNADYYAAICASAGANGFVSKDIDLREVITAIHAGLKGYSYFPLTQQVQGTSTDLADRDRIAQLSSQEFKVFQLLVDGLQNIEIASKLNLSTKTVSTYKSRMMEKLNCKKVKELYDLGQRNRL